MLEVIPKEALWYEEDVFEKDFKLVLNSVKKDQQESKDMESYCCEECKFMATSQKCLKIHIAFVHEPIFFKCEVCPMITRTELALHYHIDIKHNTHWDVEAKQDKNIKLEPNETTSMIQCEFCEKTFVSDKGITIHTSKIHKKEYKNKHKSHKEPGNKCYICGFMFITEEAFKAHTEEIHHQEYIIQRSDSLSKSPPSKKVKEHQSENMDLEQSDIFKLKDEKITELTCKVNQLQLKLKEKEENNTNLVTTKDCKYDMGKNINKGPIPHYLTPVQDQHLPDLNGIKMKADGNPGGDCLSSCTTMHISYTKDNTERRRFNSKINNHIADNFDNFYINKISLPYTETVGVGHKARRVTCNTREELLDFLRSQDSLCTYSNYQELLAIANMLNTKIHIFTYGIGGNEKSWSWKTVSPDPDMVQYSEFGPGTVPEMYLYNSDSTHFDLLVENNSRLAVMGFISMEKEKEVEEVKEVKERKELRETMVNKIPDNSQGAGICSKEQWQTVASTKKPQDKDPSFQICKKVFQTEATYSNT